MKVKLKTVEVADDADDDFSDIKGAVGDLTLHATSKDPELNFFHPVNISQGVDLCVKSVISTENEITVKTKLGNTFVFEKV